MSIGKIMALDIGTKRTGVALSDELRSFSFPHSVVERRSKAQWLSEIEQIATDSEVKEVVVGIPLDANGESGSAAEEIRKVSALLQERLKLPVIEWDERLTTVQAERSLIEADLSREKRKAVIDKIAASIILQSYLDRLQFDQGTPCDEKDWDH